MSLPHVSVDREANLPMRKPRLRLRKPGSRKRKPRSSKNAFMSVDLSDKKNKGDSAVARFLRIRCKRARIEGERHELLKIADQNARMSPRGTSGSQVSFNISFCVTWQDL